MFVFATQDNLANLSLLTPDSCSNDNMDFGPESEELDDKPSVMQFSTAVGIWLLELMSPG